MNRFETLEIRWRRYKKRLWAKRILAISLGVASLLAVGYGLLGPSLTKEASIETPSSEALVSAPKEGESAAIEVANGAFDSQSSTILGESNLKPLQEERCFVVKASLLNIREEPSLKSKILSRYVRGDEVCARLVEGNWIFSGIGWVYNGGGTLVLAGEEMEGSEIKEEKLWDKPSEEGAGRGSSQGAPVRPKPFSLQISSAPSTSKERQAFYRERYEKEPSYAAAIELAQSYFEEKDYARAYEWALLANNHQKNSVQSWSIFAKSLDFSGKKGEAMEVLERYLSFDRSGVLGKLLEEMKAGRLREEP